MQTEALDKMISEAPPAIAADAPAGAFASDAAPAMAALPPELPGPIKDLVDQGVYAASRLACSAAKVTELDVSEVAMLSQAVSGVLRFYLTPDMDPRTAAWLSLGIAAVSIAINRRPLAPAVETPPLSTNDNPSPNTVMFADGTVISP